MASVNCSRGVLRGDPRGQYRGAAVRPGPVGPAERLAAVLADAKPTVVLTTTAGRRPCELPAHLAAAGTSPDDRRGRGARHSRPDLHDGPVETDDIAYLQYTSGSTRAPAGVEITHRNVCTNVLQMVLAGDLDTGVRSVSWLPLYHDMGLIMIMFPALCGAHITLMDPMAFVRRPYRWIKALGIESAHGRTFAAAPNFAFELAAERGLPPSGDDLDLTNVVSLLNGSEPVTLSSIEKFTTAFAPYGLPVTAIKPSYGMAEATLSVASIDPSAAARRSTSIAPSSTPAGPWPWTPTPGAVAHVSCGQPIPNQWAVISSPDGAEVPDGTVGEIWLHGNNVGRGYFGRDEETQRVFGNKLQPGSQRQSCRGRSGQRMVAGHRRSRRLRRRRAVPDRADQRHDHRRRPQPLPARHRNHGERGLPRRPLRLCRRVLRPGRVSARSVEAGEQLVIVAERAAGRGPGRARPRRGRRTCRGVTPPPDPGGRRAAGRRRDHPPHDERETGPQRMPRRVHCGAIHADLGLT